MVITCNFASGNFPVTLESNEMPKSILKWGDGMSWPEMFFNIALFCRLLLASEYKVYITTWVHWPFVQHYFARKFTVLSAVLLCLIWLFQNDWCPGCLHLWREPCGTRENLVCLGNSQRSLDASGDQLQKAHAGQGNDQQFLYVRLQGSKVRHDISPLLLFSIETSLTDGNVITDKDLATKWVE